MRDLPPSIVVAPEIHSTESTASWILRVCRMHEISYSKLLKIFDLPCYVDPDVALDGPTLCRIGAGTAVKPNDMLRLGSIFRLIRKCPSLGSLLYRDENGMPAYKFCVRCLAYDRHPYLRVEWRVAGVDTCLVHRVRLKNRCWVCSTGLLATRTGVQNIQYGFTVGNCAKCGSHLAGSELQGEAEVTDEEISFQRSIVSAVLHGYFLISGCDMRLPLGFLAWLLETDQYRAVARTRDPVTLKSPLIEATVRGLYSAYIDRPLRRAWFAEAPDFV